MRFHKMHGLGNDFVVLDNLEGNINITPELIRRLSDRHFGVGCDQVLLIEPPEDPSADVRYSVVNADGTFAEHCGNGVRCVANFLQRLGIVRNGQVSIEIAGEVFKLVLESDGLVRVDMGVPKFEPSEIPILADKRARHYALEAAGQKWQLGAVSIGNPHAIVEVSDIEQAPVKELGAALQAHEYFPNKVNVGFMQIVSRQQIQLRVYERGVGETLACGTGACAAVVIGIEREQLDSRVEVTVPGGGLLIEWHGGGERVSMTGPATYVFEGQINL